MYLIHSQMGFQKNRNKEEPKPTVSCKQQICIFRFIDSSATAEPAASTNCFGRLTFTDLTLTSIIKAEIGKKKMKTIKLSSQTKLLQKQKQKPTKMPKNSKKIKLKQMMMKHRIYLQLLFHQQHKKFQLTKKESEAAISTSGRK